MTHRIRLRGPWTLEMLGSLGGGGSSPQRVMLPGDWPRLLAGRSGAAVCMRRHFNRPTGLDAGHTVWLTIEHPRGAGALTLNGTPLAIGAPGQACQVPITALLTSRNELTIEALLSDEPPWADVRLEIRGEHD